MVYRKSIVLDFKHSIDYQESLPSKRVLAELDFYNIYKIQDNIYLAGNVCFNDILCKIKLSPKQMENLREYDDSVVFDLTITEVEIIEPFLNIYADYDIRKSENVYIDIDLKTYPSTNPIRIITAHGICNDFYIEEQTK